MSISDASDFKEVVASFHKKSDLDSAVEDLINLGVHKYELMSYVQRPALS